MITVSILHYIILCPAYLDPGAVDKDVHPALGLQHLGSKLLHRGEAGQVTVLNLELPLNKLPVLRKIKEKRSHLEQDN